MRLVAALLGNLFAMSAAAQPYPSKPVREVARTAKVKLD